MYYIKATLKGMKANCDGYQYVMGINRHPDPDKSNELCSRGFHLANTPKDALSYTPEATELYLCQPIGEVYAKGCDKIRVGEVDILWRIPDKYFQQYKKVWKTYKEAREAYEQAWEAYKKASKTSDKSRRKLGQDFMDKVIKEYEDYQNLALNRRLSNATD